MNRGCISVFLLGLQICLPGMLILPWMFSKYVNRIAGSWHAISMRFAGSEWALLSVNPRRGAKLVTKVLCGRSEGSANKNCAIKEGALLRPFFVLLKNLLCYLFLRSSLATTPSLIWTTR